MKGRVSQSPIGCATHSISFHGMSLGQFEWAFGLYHELQWAVYEQVRALFFRNKSDTIPSFTNARGMEGLVGLGRKPKPRTWTQEHAIASAFSNCALPYAFIEDLV